MPAIKEPPCPFCEIVALRAPATIVTGWSEAIAIVPLRPVVEGHTLILPKRHIEDATWDYTLTGKVFARASEYAHKRDQDFNLITSGGHAATQTVWHLHVHYVPRKLGDGLALPWTNQEERT